ncbi:MAG: methyltransferase domain-containing protein [Bacillota bacterium]|nr:methyltransferase domain-containing protein [Bacillota bacterium]
MDYLEDKISFDNDMVCCYDELPLWSSPFGIMLLNNIPLKRNSSVVDIGCGTGFPLLELAQRLGESCRIFGIDPWEAAVSRAIRKKEQFRIKNVEIIKGVGEDMPFSGEQIDMITSNLGINNFEDPDRILKECFRVIKPGGKLIFTTNLYGHFDEFYLLFRAVLCCLKLEDEVSRLSKHIKKRYSMEAIEELVNRNGFLVKKVIRDNYSMRFADGSAFLNHYFIKLAFLQDWKEIVPENHRNAVFTALENRLNEIAEKNGEILFTVPMAYVECEK